MRVILIVLIAGMFFCNIVKADTATVWLNTASMTINSGGTDVFTATSTLGSNPNYDGAAGMGNIAGTSTTAVYTVSLDFNDSTHALTGGNLSVSTVSPSATVFSSSNAVSYNSAGIATGSPQPTEYLYYQFIEGPATSYAPAGALLNGDFEFDPTTGYAISNFFSSWSINGSEANMYLLKGDVSVVPLPSPFVPGAWFLTGFGVLYVLRKKAPVRHAGIN